MKKRNKIILLFVLCTALLYSLPLFKVWQHSQSFKNLYHSLFKEEMLSDTLSMHYTLAKPENYGIYHYTPTLSGDTSSKELTPAAALDQLEHISKEYLSVKEQYQYDNLKYRLQLEKTLDSFSYYIEPCSMNGGSITNLVILLSEYTFYRERDVKDYLVLLSQTGSYLENILSYEKERDRLGLSCGRSLYDSVESISQELSTLAPSILKESFAQRLDSLSLPDTRKTAYLKQHETLLAKVVAPAYDSFATEITTLGADSTRALCKYPHGKEFYAAFLQYKTGVSKSPQEILLALSTDIDQTYTSIKRILSKYPVSQYAELLEESAYPPDAAPGDWLALLEDKMKSLYPVLKDTKPLVKTVNPGLEPISAPAFYLSSPLDLQDVSLIYINPSSTVSALETFTTLAHEGFPGHMYQDLYQHKIRSVNENKLYTLLGFTGYNEAWALYSEFCAYQLAAVMAKQENDSTSSDRICLEALYRRLSMAALSYGDIAIHFMNASEKELLKQLTALGYRADSIHKLYQFLLENPVYYPSYYVSYLGLCDVRSYIKAQLKEEFTPMAFHQYYLEKGPASFSYMKEYYKKLK